MVAASGPLAGTSPAQAKKIIIVAGVGAGVLSTIAAYRRTTNAPPIRVAAGALAATAILSAVAEFAPQLAAGFAALLLATASFVVGGDAWAAVSQITAPAPIRN